MFSSSSLAKGWFVLSVAVLGVGYGIAAQQWGWFPSSLARQAFLQVENLGWAKSSLYTHRAVYDREGTRTLKPNEMEPGVTAIASWWRVSGEDKYGVKLIDEKGQTLHKWWVDRRSLFQEGESGKRDPLGAHVDGFSLLPNGDIVLDLYYVGLIRLNSCGDVSWTVPAGAHHSVTRTADGSFWAPGVSQKRRTESESYPDGFPGLGSVWLDQALHVSADGKVLDRINIVDVLYENDLEHLIFSHRRTSGDVTHLNDADELSKSMADSYPLFEGGDILVSPRNINAVFVFDPDTKKIKWYSTEPFIQQHDPDYIGDGWIGIFDNNWKRGRDKGGSRIMGVQPHTDSTRVIFEPKHLDRFYTIHKGDWGKLSNGNMLLTESAAGRVVEVSSDGRLIWEWIHESYEPGMFGPSGAIIPAVPVARRYDLSREEIASWPCSSVDSVNVSSTTQ